MQCPKCNHEMDLMKHDTSRSRLQEKIYDRTIYGCQHDDVWVTIEIPQQKSMNTETEALPVVSV